MTTLVVGYVVVWLGVSSYVAWLGVRQNQLDARLIALASQSSERAGTRGTHADAA